MQGAGASPHSRHLLDHFDPELSIAEATQVLRSFGVSEFDTIIHRARAPTCHVDELPANAIGHILNLCSSIDLVEECSATAAPERNLGPAGAPLFRMHCRNATCVDAFSPPLTECLLARQVAADRNASAGAAGADAGALAGCDESTISLALLEEEVARTTGILGALVAGKGVFECLTGYPTGTTIDHGTRCVGSRFQSDVIVRLAEDLTEGVDYECIWFGRCKGEEACCDNDQPFEGGFICYLPKGGEPASLADSAAVPGARLAPPLLLAGCLASLWHLILALAL